ncbi:hypothetical protein GGG16DRAFT_45672 [Schizophyllum commune]
MSNPLLDIYSRIYREHTNFIMMLSAFYGIHVAVYLAAISTLARRTSNGYFLLIITTLLFVVSTVWFMVNFHLEIAVALAAFRPDVFDILRHVASPLLVIVRINHVLSDVVVVWRAWILWPRSKRIRSCVPTGHSYTLPAGSIVELAYSYTKFGWLAYAANLPEQSANYSRAFLTILPVILTNVLSTALVGYKVWCYRRNVKSSLSGIAQTRVEKILLLLVESGVIYSAIWVIYLGVVLADIKGAFDSDLTHMGPAAMMGPVMPAIAGIYPTVVVIISAAQSSPTHYIPTVHLSETTRTDATSTRRESAWGGRRASPLEIERDNSSTSETLMLASLSRKSTATSSAKDNLGTSSSCWIDD